MLKSMRPYKCSYLLTLPPPQLPKFAMAPSPANPSYQQPIKNQPFCMIQDVALTVAGSWASKLLVPPGKFGGPLFQLVQAILLC